MKSRLMMLALLCFVILGLSRGVLAQDVTADIFRLNDTREDGDGQFWESKEDSTNSLLFTYGPLGEPLTNANNRLKITAQGTIISTADPNAGVETEIPTNVGGNRFIWYPFKGAFRAGGVALAQWNENQIGQNSFATGFNTVASGSTSTALGSHTFASGSDSVAIGSFVQSTAQSSVTIGMGNLASVLRNTIPNSLMVGFLSTTPTLFVGPSPGSGSATGSVGIGTTNTQGFKLFVNGSIAATSFSQVSDIRLKANIRSIDNALNKVLKLEGIKYEWKNGVNPDLTLPDSTQIGFSAQDVEKVLPELVTTNSEGFKAVSYQNMSAVLVEAVKEQQKTIEQQQTELEQVKRQLQVLVEKLNPNVTDKN
jgi:hypothetical protein